MLAIQIAETIFYFGACCLVTWISRRSALGLVGVILALTNLISATMFFIHVGISSRLVVEIIGEIVIVGAARLSFLAGGAKAARGIIILAASDVAFCAAISYGMTIGIISHSWAEFYYGNGSNVILLGQCVCVVVPGVHDAYMRWMVAIGARRRVDHTRADMDFLLRYMDRK